MRIKTMSWEEIQNVPHTFPITEDCLAYIQIDAQRYARNKQSDIDQGKIGSSYGFSSIYDTEVGIHRVINIVLEYYICEGNKQIPKWTVVEVIHD